MSEIVGAYSEHEGQAYSCNGLILLGYILGKIYNKLLEEIFEEQLKNPLGYSGDEQKLYAKEIYDLAEKDYTPDFAEGRGLGWLYVDERYPQTGKLFDRCGHTGCSIFFSRKKNMYAIVLTNATRHLNMKNEFNGYDYNLICKMREEIHNEIYRDLNV